MIRHNHMFDHSDTAMAWYAWGDVTNQEWNFSGTRGRPMVMRHSLALTKINAEASWGYPVGKGVSLPKLLDGFCSEAFG